MAQQLAHADRLALDVRLEVGRRRQLQHHPGEEFGHLRQTQAPHTAETAEAAEVTGAVEATTASATVRARTPDGWVLARTDQLSPLELYGILQLRSRVFVVEQNCVYGDVDGLDVDAWHLLAYGEGEKRPTLAGYLRVLLPGFAFRYHKGKAFPEGLLKGRSADLLVSMDTPPWYFRWFYRQPGIWQMKTTTLEFSGVRPVRVLRCGPLIGSTPVWRERWLVQAEALGRRL